MPQRKENRAVELICVASAAHVSLQGFPLYLYSICFFVLHLSDNRVVFYSFLFWHDVGVLIVMTCLHFSEQKPLGALPIS